MFSILDGQTINCHVIRQSLRLLKQQEGERFDTFVVRCKRVISRCAYNDSTDALLDTLLAGIPTRFRDQACPTTSLQGLRSICLTAEAITGTPQTNILSITKPKEVQKPDSSPCTNCGRSHTICPAIGSNCSNCGRRNHWASCCRSRGLAMPRPRLHVINETPREDHRTEVYVDLPVLNDTYIVKAKVDTGAQANVLPYHIYALLRHPPPITKPLTILVSYNYQIRYQPGGPRR